MQLQLGHWYHDLSSNSLIVEYLSTNSQTSLKYLSNISQASLKNLSNISLKTSLKYLSNTSYGKSGNTATNFMAMSENHKAAGQFVFLTSLGAFSCSSAIACGLPPSNAASFSNCWLPKHCQPHKNLPGAACTS